MVSGLILLSLALLQATQQPTAQMGTPKPLGSDAVEKCILEGKVISAIDGAPLKKASVTLLPQAQPGIMPRPVSATTDAEGKFVFRDLQPLGYMVNVTRNGYARQNYGARTPYGPGTVISLSAGQHVKDVNVRLTPGAAVNGRIVDEDNDPVGGASVMAMRWSYLRGKRQLVPVGHGQTDDRGNYRIYGLAPGRVYVSATFRDMNFMASDSNAGEKEAYAPTYYPGAFDISQASALELKPGDDLMGIVFRLSRVQAVHVSGAVRGPDGEPMKSAMVQVTPRGQSMFTSMDLQMSMTDDKGNFTLSGVRPGAYIVSVRGSFDQEQIFGRTDIDVGTAPVENIVIQAGKGMEIETEVRLDGSVDLSKSNVRLFLSPNDMMPFAGNSSVQVKEKGTVTLTRVFDGNYTLRASSLPDDSYISKATFGETDVLEDGLKVNGGAAGRLDVTISAAGAHLEGSVVDKENKAFSGAQVVLVPEESKLSRLDLFRSVTSDQYGHFVLRAVPPGTYRLFAWEAIDSGAYMDPDFLKAYEDQGKTVHLSAGERSNPELKVIASAKTGP